MGHLTGFPTGVENMRGGQNLMEGEVGEGLGAWGMGGGLKTASLKSS